MRQASYDVALLLLLPPPLLLLLLLSAGRCSKGPRAGLRGVGPIQLLGKAHDIKHRSRARNTGDLPVRRRCDGELQNPFGITALASPCPPH
jgi:hypothetical protein